MKNKKNIQAPGAKGSRGKKAVWLAVIAVLLILAAVLTWYLLRYRFNYEYRQYITEPAAMENGSEFTAMDDDDPADAGKGFLLAAENDVLKLYANPESADVAVYDKRDGAFVYSTPPEANSDKIANKTNKNYLKSQFIVEYFNAGLTTNSYDSFSKCVDLGNVKAESIQDGVRFIYEVGEEVDVYYVPAMLSNERYQQLYDSADKKVKDLMSGKPNSYYAQSEDGNWRVTENGLKMSIRNLNNVSKHFVEQGMTPEEYYSWQEQAGVEVVETLGFTIVLEWRLKGDAVECTVPAQAIEERGGGMVSRIQLLPYMGAAGMDENGYIVVPGGSGAIINFNNGKQGNAVYNQYVYEMDLVDAEYTKTQNTQSVRMPLFALCREKSTVLATIEKGASLATITADVSGRSNSYNNAYASFILRGDEKLVMFGAGETADLPIVEDDLYPETLTVRYTLLGEDKTGYSGVANHYRERLISEGVLTDMADGGATPFYYDVIGGVKETTHTLGVQHLQVEAMTTFDQAAEMAAILAEKGVANQVMNFQGWMNGGYYHDVPDKVKVQRQLGGKKDFLALNEAIKNLGGELYGDVAFQNVTYIAKRYRYNDESSRYYGAGYAVGLGEVNPTNLRRTASLGYAENLYDLLSPKFLPYYVEHFINATKDMQEVGVSLRDLGYELHSDKRRTNVINREEALMVVESQLDALRETGRSLMVSGANDYAWQGAKHLINVPMGTTEYFIVDGEIPLYQMIVHGCADYTGVALNTTVDDDPRTELLKLVEYGASPRYVFTWQDATEMKYTGLNKFYATTFTAWADEAAQSYRYVSGALDAVHGAQMIAHETLENGVKRVTYSNGTTIYVNYAGNDEQADGYTIPAKDYIVMGGVK